MKLKHTYLFAIGLIACHSSLLGDELPPCCENHSQHMESGESAKPSELSLFNLESHWENKDQSIGPLSQISGRTQIVAMMYTTCKYACPRILADLRRIESELSETERDSIGICLITIDPDRDTVERFNEYAASQNLDPKRWNFLRGSKADTLELANLIGVKYKLLPDGEFAHSNIISLLNAKGEIVHQQVGLGADPSALVAKAKALIENHPSS